MAERPELLRTGGFEQFGLINLTEYPDDGPTIHPTPSNKAGNTIDWTLEENSLLGAGTGTDPIDFTVPFDLEQAAMTDAERAVVLDVLALVHGAQAAGAQVRSVSIGGTGGSPSYARIRSVLTALGVPSVNPASGHHAFFTVNLLPPQGETELPQNLQDALVSVLEALRDNFVPAVLAQDEMQVVLPLVDRTIADSIDLEQAMTLGLLQPVSQLLLMESAPRVHDLQRTLQDRVTQQDTLRVELNDVHVDIDQTQGAGELRVQLHAAGAADQRRRPGRRSAAKQRQRPAGCVGRPRGGDELCRRSDGSLGGPYSRRFYCGRRCRSPTSR